MGVAPIIYSGSQSLDGAALSLVTNVAGLGRTCNTTIVQTVANVRRLLAVTLKAASAITQTVTVTLNSHKGSAYDVLLTSSSLAAATDFAYIPDEEILLGPGDNVTLACTNTGTPAILVYGQILTRE
jgi:hypothetical protein